MSGLTIEFDADTAAKVRQAAEREGLSGQAWVMRLVQQGLLRSPASVSPEAWRELVERFAGSGADVPEFEPDSEQGKRLRREALERLFERADEEGRLYALPDGYRFSRQELYEADRRSNLKPRFPALPLRRAG